MKEEDIPLDIVTQLKKLEEHSRNIMPEPMKSDPMWSIQHEYNGYIIKNGIITSKEEEDFIKKIDIKD